MTKEKQAVGKVGQYYFYQLIWNVFLYLATKRGGRPFYSII